MLAFKKFARRNKHLNGLVVKVLDLKFVVIFCCLLNPDVFEKVGEQAFELINILGF